MSMVFVEPTRRDYRLIAGNSFRDVFTVSVSGTPVNLSGWTARLQARQHAYDEPPIVDLSTATGGIVLGGADGAVTLYAPPATTRAWGPGVLTYQFELQDAAGDVQTFTYGELVIEPEWTR